MNLIITPVRGEVLITTCLPCHYCLQNCTSRNFGVCSRAVASPRCQFAFQSATSLSEEERVTFLVALIVFKEVSTLIIVVDRQK